MTPRVLLTGAALGVGLASLAWAYPEGSSGFQLIASAEGQPAGLFESGDRDVESAACGAQIRSTATRPTTGDMARWRLVWRAPAKLDGPVIFHAAASAANDDGSPFGDQIHYREFSREPLLRTKKKGPLAPKD